MSGRLSFLLATLRVGWRIQRFELIFVLAVGALAALAAVVVAYRLSEVAPPMDCLLRFMTAGELPAGCASPEAFFQRDTDEGGNVMAVMTVLPFVIGAIPGSTLVATEIEHRTVQLAWMLEPSRRRWLLGRLLPIALVVIVAASLAATAGDVLERSRAPWLDPGSSFNDYGSRGPVLVARTLAFSSIGVLSGALMGRQVPALLAALGFAMVIFLAMNTARPFGEPLTSVSLVDPSRSDLVVSVRARSGVMSLSDSDPMGVPGERMRAVELRESALLGAAALLATLATIVVVERRRPY